MKKTSIIIFLTLLFSSVFAQNQTPLRSIHLSYTENLSNVDSIPVVNQDSIALRVVISYNDFSNVKAIKINCLNEFNELVFSKILVIDNSPLGVSDTLHKYVKIALGTVNPLINKVIIKTTMKDIIRKVEIVATDSNDNILNSKTSLL